MIMTLTKHELTVLRPILQECSDELSNKNCNDVTLPNTAENRALARELYLDNCRGDEKIFEKQYGDQMKTYWETYANGDPIKLNIYLIDWMVFDFLLKKAGVL